MKHNTMKRVLAATLSVLTVASPIGANVGGFINTAEYAITAAAVGDTKVTWEEQLAGCITSMTDGENSRTATDIDGSDNYKFTENTVLTIESKVPLSFNDGADDFTNTDGGAVLPATTNLLEKDGTDYKYAKKYLVTEKEDGTYTYKVRVVANLTIAGEKATNVTIKNETKTDAFILGDGTHVATTEVTGDITLNGEAIASVYTGTDALIKKSTVKIAAAKAFEAYAWTDNATTIPKVEAIYDTKTGKFVAEVTIPNSDNSTIYLNKVNPNYTYTNNGTALTATAENAPTVTAASITATYEAKVKKSKDEPRVLTEPYKYDAKADMATGATVPNESRVVLTFTNDVTGEITSASADNKYFALKITKDGKELIDNAMPFVNAADNVAYPASAATTTYGDSGIKYSATNHVPGAAVATDAKASLAFSATGVYKVEYTVYTKTTASNGQVSLTPQTLTYDFTIATKDLLKSNNVRLTATDEQADGSSVLVGSTNGDHDNNVDTPDKNFIKKVGIENGVVKFEVTDAWNGETITVTPTIFDDADKAADIATYAASTFNAGPDAIGTPKSITGTDKNNVLNVENEMTIVYNNADYSANDQSIKVKWMLVPQKKTVTITANELSDKHADWANKNDVAAATAYFTTTVDQLATFREDLLDTVKVTNGEASKVEFEYVEGYGNSAESEELDDHISGLPEKAGKYSVYFLYEGEIVEAVNVEVAEHALFASLTAAQQSYTYGTKKLTNDDLTFVDFNGNEVKDAGVKYANIVTHKALKLTALQCKNITVANKITFAAAATSDGGNANDILAGTYDVFTIGSDKYIESQNENAGETVQNYINAGNYIVTVADNGNAEIGKEGYKLLSKKFTLTVTKKALTPDMVTIDPVQWTGGSVSPAAATVRDRDIKANVVGCTYAGGDTSGSAVGKYTIGVQAPANGNYTGKVNAGWTIVKNAKNEMMNGLKFVVGKTTIKDNGRIHFEIERPADSQFSKGVAQFGVVFDKEGRLPAPTKNAGAGTANYPAGKYPRTGNNPVPTNHTLVYTNEVNDGFAAKDEFDRAAKNLQLGNGFGEGKQDPDKAANKLVYGANVNVVDVETGCWFRPYVIDGDGEIYYGEVCYVNLVQEATDALQLKLAKYDANTPKAVLTKAEAKKDQSATVLANKTWRDQVQSGYNEKEGKYYVYGSYTLEGNELVKESAVQGFGVVVDKTGAFNVNGKLATDDTVTVEEGLKLGNGFIEGKAGSNKMEADEYGANITPVNTVTGVWVRAYVDLGRGKNAQGEELASNLIVYTDPVYIKDVSSIYDGSVGIEANNAVVNTDAEAKTPTNKASYVKETNKQRVNVNSGAITNATLKQSGVIVDKSGSFLLKYSTGANIGKYVTGTEAANANVLGGHNDAVTDGFTDKNLAAAKAKMILGNGYLQGKRAVNNGAYTVTFSQDKYRPTAGAAETNIPAVIRPFSIYEINNKEIVVYGDPIVTTKNSPDILG